MTKERIDEIDRFSGVCPTNLHEERRKEGSEHPQAIDQQKDYETMTANPMQEGLSRRIDVCGQGHGHSPSSASCCSSAF